MSMDQMYQTCIDGYLVAFEDAFVVLEDGSIRTNVEDVFKASVLWAAHKTAIENATCPIGKAFTMPGLEALEDEATPADIQATIMMYAFAKTAYHKYCRIRGRVIA